MAEGSLVKRLSFAALAAASVLLLAACAPIGNAPVANYQGVPDLGAPAPAGEESDEGGSLSADDEVPEVPEPEGEQRDLAAEVMDGPVAAWLEEGAQLAVSIGGSSTCPYIGSAIHVIEGEGEGNTVRIDIEPLPDRPCTMDFVPHTTVFWTPMDVSTTVPLTVQVMDQEITVPVK
jgi:hypothetical protein